MQKQSTNICWYLSDKHEKQNKNTKPWMIVPLRERAFVYVNVCVCVWESTHSRNWPPSHSTQTFEYFPKKK